jgi:uncharacterized protein (TIGR02145 family)
MSCQNYKVKSTSSNCIPDDALTTGNFLYNGAPLSCLDIQTGTVLNDAIKEIDALICQTLNNLTTTTTTSSSTSTTTSTTTIASQEICVAQGYEAVGEGLFISTTNLPQPTLFNNKVWYQLIDNGLGNNVGSIYWSIALNAWVASGSLIPNTPDVNVYQILDNNDNPLPISDSTYQWESFIDPPFSCESGGGAICSTSLGSCPPVDICFTVTREIPGFCSVTVSSEPTYFNDRVWYKIVGTSCAGVIDLVYWSSDLNKWVAVASSSPSPNPSTDVIIQTLENFYVYPISGEGMPPAIWEPYEGNPDYDCATSAFGGIICSSTLGECSATTTSTTTAAPCSQAICGLTYEGYGYLYNWFITQSSTLPGGLVNIYQPYTDERNQWTVPTDDDWTTLTTYLGGESVAGGKLKTTCTYPFDTNNGLWESPNTSATNEVNWAGVPGGNRYYNGSFYAIGSNGLWWSSTEFNATSAWMRFLLYNLGVVYRLHYDKTYGFSVRLVRPATVAEQALPDGTTSNDNPLLPHYIGNTRGYITVKIGNQVWTAQNLVEEKYNDGSLIPEVTDNTAWASLTTGARCSYNNGAPLDNGTVELCGTTDVVPTCCPPVIDEVVMGSLVIPDVYEGPATFIYYTYPGTDLCIDCVNVSIEYSIDNGETWTFLDIGPCTDSPRAYTIEELNITLAGSLWRAKTSCVGGGESLYSSVYTYIP